MTVLEGYKKAVRSARPNARLTVVRAQDGCRWYLIVDGDERLSGEEGGPTAAWRDADYRLANPHLPAAQA